MNPSTLYLILRALISIPLICIAIVLIFFAVTAPFEFLKYRKSSYYRKYREKYQWGTTGGEAFKVADHLTDAGVALDDVSLRDSRLVIGGITCFCPHCEVIEFGENGECLLADEEGQVAVPLTEFYDIGDRDDVRLLVNSKIYDNIDIEKAKACPMLIVYDELSDLPELLKQNEV